MGHFSSPKEHLRPRKCPTGRKEALLHIHGNQMNFNAINSHSAAAERAVASQRAADVRRKLMKSTSDIEGISSPNEHFMVGQWMGQQNGQSFTEDEFHAGRSGRDSDFG
jgi:hypothetical protein